MKKLFTVLSVMALMFTVTDTFASKYKINDATIENLFANSYDATDMAIAGLGQDLNSATEQSGAVIKSGDKSAIMAWVLCWLLGYLGVHRLYLGSNIGVFLGYLLTAGGCGILWTVDYILLFIGLINDDIGDYEDCTRFFMWSC